MNSKWIKLSGVALMSLYLAACDADEEVVEEENTEMVEDESTDDHDHEDDEHGHDEDDHDHEDDEDDHDHEDDEDDHGDHDHEDDEDDHDHDDHAHGHDEAEESVEIDGVAHHYHTGELIELTAVLEEDGGYDDWHWYTREDDSADWEIVSGQHSNEFVAEAPEESMEIRAVLYDDAHAPFAQSSPVEIEVDNH